ncbi:hypothetical protein F7725_014804 [Dissostichus mawsoni]|uniref:Uncharacterized protein n=1 Tax=Dissostichus mawsoni TaxID=36200 RepID=A0A7J5YXG0_DISMA|nr:hypothetical protein F7725_014804 [Dissostichus mawsoni]
MECEVDGDAENMNINTVKMYQFTEAAFLPAVWLRIFYRIKIMPPSVDCNSFVEVPPQTEGGELLGLLSPDLCHIQSPRLQVQVHQVGLHLLSQLDHTDHPALADQTHGGSLQQRDLYFLSGVSGRSRGVLGEAASPGPQPLPGDGVEHLDPLVAPVGHPHPVVVVHGDAVGDVELSHALSFLSVHPHHLVVFGQLDEAVHLPPSPSTMYISPEGWTKISAGWSNWRGSFPDGEYCLTLWPYGPFPTSVIHTVGLAEAASARNIPWGISRVVVFQDMRNSPSVENTSTLGTSAPEGQASDCASLTAFFIVSRMTVSKGQRHLSCSVNHREAIPWRSRTARSTWLISSAGRQTVCWWLGSSSVHGAAEGQSYQTAATHPGALEERDPSRGHEVPPRSGAAPPAQVQPPPSSPALLTQTPGQLQPSGPPAAEGVREREYDTLLYQLQTRQTGGCQPLTTPRQDPAGGAADHHRGPAAPGDPPDGREPAAALGERPLRSEATDADFVECSELWGNSQAGGALGTGGEQVRRSTGGKGKEIAIPSCPAGDARAGGPSLRFSFFCLPLSERNKKMNTQAHDEDSGSW